MEKQTLGEKTAQMLLEMIQKEGFGPGDKLPTEAELVESLGVGRNTVREALRILMSRNIVTIRQGSGTFISEKKGVVDDPLGFSMMEPQLAALAAQNAAEEDLQKLEQIKEELEDLIRQRKDYSLKDSQFHEQIANCSHNQIMTNLVPVITEGVRMFAVSVQETEYEQTLSSHRRIFEAIRDRRGEDAKMEMYFHLMYNSNRYRAETEP